MFCNDFKLPFTFTESSQCRHNKDEDDRQKINNISTV